MSSYPLVPSEDYTGFTTRQHEGYTDVFFWREGFYVYDVALPSKVNVQAWIDSFFDGDKPEDWDEMTGNMSFSQYIGDVKAAR